MKHLIACALPLLMAVTGAGQAARPLPETGEVIQRFIERSMQSASNRLTGSYAYFRTNITEELSRKGEVTEREEKVYRVVVRDGRRQGDLLSVNGRTPDAKERDQDWERRRRKNESDAKNETPDRSRQVDAFITLDILSRYLFNVEGRDTINGRSCIKVSFKPAPGERDSDRMVDRVLDRIGGVLWIDEMEHELVKADVSLREKVSFWGGLLGALDQLKLVINRQRESDGRWRDQSTHAHFVGRAVAKRINVRTQDLSSAAEPQDQTPVVAAD